LFNPFTLINQPLSVLLTFLIIVVAKSLAALLIIRLFRQPGDVGYPVAIGLSQIGEFSFILGDLALNRGLIAQELYNLILAGALLSIVVNPLLFRIYDVHLAKKDKQST